MTNRNRTVLALAFLAHAMSATAAIRYVNVNSASPTPPYTNWNTAAATIQDAVDVAVAGDQILVTNGVYQTGGKTVAAAGGTMTNRVTVDKSVLVQSVNGPQFTVIQGYQVPFTTNGNGAIRCVYLTNGASLSGFTLTNGATVNGQSGGGVWCQSANPVVTNCVLVGSSASSSGGGAFGGTLNNCALGGNSASDGGGAHSGTLNNCSLTGNSARFRGCGAAYAILNKCTLAGNSGGDYGGGVFYSTLNNCTLSGNSAKIAGGGSSVSTLNNCILTGNSAGSSGGAEVGALNNCTLTGNSADTRAGGAKDCALRNCIVYFNTAPQGANHLMCLLLYCCTTPQPADGTGNISADPQLAGTSHLSIASPCRGKGSAAYAVGTDIDGEAWGSPPSIGCDEYHAGAVTGPLSVSIGAAFTNVAPSYPLQFTAWIDGRTSASVWDFGDGLLITNQPYAAHAWTAPGDYAVVLRAYNESQPAGVSATVTVHVVAQAVHHVAANSTNPVAPYTSWGTAATRIQDAVDSATALGALVLVTNGTYATGGRAVAGTMTNRVVVDKPVRLRSVNGPQLTVIQGHQVPGTTNGDGTIRCVYLAGGASLSGFTLISGAGDNGGGVWCGSTTAVISNCVLTGNSAAKLGGGAFGGMLDSCTLTGNSASNGGGAYNSTLNNCILASNSAGFDGGGAYRSTLSNCTLTGNSAVGPWSRGGGVFGGAGSTLNNCTLNANSAPYGGGAYVMSWDSVSRDTLNNCTLSGNSAVWGAGVYGYDGGTLNNCTVVSNVAAGLGGGALGGALYNCIVYFNTAYKFANYHEDIRDSLSPTTVYLNHCCTTPLPTNGIGNISSDPRFVDEVAGNLRLQSNSPCINSGLNASAPAGFDLDGNPRIAGGTVDIGAYEFQSPASVISYAWSQRYGFPTDGSADYLDSDSDLMNNWQEWIAGTIPTNALSALRLLDPTNNVSGVTVSWQSVSNRTYFLERDTNLGAQPPFLLLRSNIIGQAGTTSHTDTNAIGPGPFFYRVGVQ